MPKAPQQAEITVVKTMQMGLGEALQRLLKVELLLQRGIAAVPETTREERKLIIDALNTHKLDLGFDCNLDGVPDTVEIFAKSAETACCKIVTTDTSRSNKPVSSRRKPKTQEEVSAQAETDAIMQAAAKATEETEQTKTSKKRAPAKKASRRSSKK